MSLGGGGGGGGRGGGRVVVGEFNEICIVSENPN